MAESELDRIAEIDRTETIRTGYRLTDGKLERIDVVWDSPPWTSNGDQPHSVQHQIDFCSAHLSKDGAMYGAFAGDRLVGLGLVRWHVRPGVAQLAFLHVSHGHRRMGIGGRITRALIAAAKERGVGSMYVSATPSASAVGFYVKHGFELAAEPLPELYREEPEDIHMLLDLKADT